MQIYLDSGDWQLYAKYHPYIEGITTNPTLLRSGGVTQYTDWARYAVSCAWGKPISLEVFADDMDEMEKQARTLAATGTNVYIKIPIINTHGDSTAYLISTLSGEGFKLNITAITTFEQIRVAARSLYPEISSIISIFCGRIADTGIDPVPFISTALNVKHNKTQILWASAREVYNIKQAQDARADIITLSPALLNKYLEQNGKDLAQLSLETVKQFHEDSKGITF